MSGLWLGVMGSMLLLVLAVLLVVWLIERDRIKSAQDAVMRDVWWEPGDFWASRERQSRKGHHGRVKESHH